jgi:hypothetical protein
MDNSFSLPDVLNNLIKKKISCCSAVRPNRRECHTFLLASYWFLTWLNLRPWRLRQNDLLKRWWTSTRLCCITLQKTVLLIGYACYLLPPKCRWTSRLRGIIYQKTVLFIGCVCSLLLSDFLLDLLLTPKNGGSMFLQNVNGLLQHYIMLCPRRRSSNSSRYEVVSIISRIGAAICTAVLVTRCNGRW